jgi:hypothetical protein
MDDQPFFGLVRGLFQPVGEFIQGRDLFERRFQRGQVAFQAVGRKFSLRVGNASHRGPAIHEGLAVVFPPCDEQCNALHVPDVRNKPAGGGGRIRNFLMFFRMESR